MGNNKDGRPRRTYESGLAEGREVGLNMVWRYLVDVQNLRILEPEDGLREGRKIAAPPGMALDEHGEVRPK